MSRTIIKGTIAIVLAIITTTAYTLTLYTVTDLGTLGGISSFGQSVNDSGQVTGASKTASSGLNNHAFVWDATNGMIDLGGTNSAGWGINNSGQITGYSQVTPGSSATHAFVGDASGLTDLGALDGNISYGYDINDYGQVAGWSRTGPPPQQHSACLCRGCGERSDRPRHPRRDQQLWLRHQRQRAGNGGITHC